MHLKETTIRINHFIDTGLKAVSKFMAAIAAIVLGIMMLITVIDVVGRYFFNRPINGSWELIGFLLVCAGTWGLAYCQVTKAHIQVTVLLDIFPEKVRNIITLIAYIMGLVAFSLIFRRSVLLTQKYMTETGHVSDTLEIPYYPFTILMAIGVGMLVVILLYEVIHSIGKVVHS
jgi:TRAP-type C4-dicarboxylate transport system permease small subunit